MPDNLQVAGTNVRIISDCWTVVPSDTIDFPNNKEAAGFYVGGTGNVTIKKRNGTLQQFMAIPTGLLLPVSCVGIMATGTTATFIVALV